MLFANALADALTHHPEVLTDHSEIKRRKASLIQSIPYPELVPLIEWSMNDNEIDARLHIVHEGVSWNMVGYLINDVPKWAYTKNTNVGSFQTDFRKAFAAGYRFAKEFQETIKNDQP